jgi:hypothetical protein
MLVKLMTTKRDLFNGNTKTELQGFAWVIGGACY